MKRPKHKVRHGVEQQPLVQQGTVNLKLEYVIPENLLSQFSDQFFVSFTDDEFVLSFYQNQHPADLRGATLSNVSAMKSLCISRVVVTPQHMSKIIDSLISNWNRWVDTHGEQAATGEQEPTKEQLEGA